MHTRFPRLTMLAATIVIAMAGCGQSSSNGIEADVTIYVSGVLLERGGVVIVNPLPVSDVRWRELDVQSDPALQPPGNLPAIAPAGRRMVVSIDQPFSEIQFLYPQGRGKYTFRFRPRPGAGATDLETRLLSIGGIDGDTGLGQAMPHGFTGMATSGDQTIQIIGPQTSERAARVLATLRDDTHAKPLTCDTRTAVSVCVYSASDWADVKKAWDTGTAALEKEYRRMETLNTCYREAERAAKGDGSCHLVSDESAEAVYEFRANPAR